MTLDSLSIHQQRLRPQRLRPTQVMEPLPGSLLLQQLEFCPSC